MQEKNVLINKYSRADKMTQWVKVLPPESDACNTQERIDSGKLSSDFHTCAGMRTL